MVSCRACSIREGMHPSPLDHYEQEGDQTIVTTETVWYCNQCWLGLRAGAHFYAMGVTE